MGISKNTRNTATSVSFEGGNNINRIGGSCFCIRQLSEDGKSVTRIVFDGGALFAPESSGADVFVADMLKFFSVDDDSLKKAFPGVSQAEINRIREIYKSHKIGSQKADAIFVTHMHEDHIGGLVRLLQAGIKLPKIYASDTTIAEIKRLCSEHHLTNVPETQVVEPYQTVEINKSYSVSAIPVSHSTINPYAYYTNTKYFGEEIGILNMGDYNLEKAKIGEGFDQEKLEEFLRGKPLNAVLVDSTSATLGLPISNNPVTHDEAAQNMSKIMDKYPDKLIIAPVISRSTANERNILEAAKIKERKVFQDGYMLRQTYDVIQKLGYMEEYKDTVYNHEDVVHADITAFMSQVPDNNGVAIISGASAEGLHKASNVSVLVKIAKGEHPLSKKISNSVFIFAQRAIPVGTIPEDLAEVMTILEQKGAVIVKNDIGDPEEKYEHIRLQRSGHANSEELDKLLKILLDIRGNKDEDMFAIPVHGSYKQLHETAAVADKAGAKVFLAFNGYKINIDRDGPTTIESKMNETNWMTFSDVYEHGQLQGSTMGYCTEIIKDNKISYINHEHVVNIPVLNGNGGQQSSYSYEDNNARIIAKFEEDEYRPRRSKSKKSGNKSFSKGGRGGR